MKVKTFKLFTKKIKNVFIATDFSNVSAFCCNYTTNSLSAALFSCFI